MKTQTLSNLIFIGLVFAIALLLVLAPGLSFAQTDSAVNDKGTTGTTLDSSDSSSGGDGDDTSTGTSSSEEPRTRVQNLRDSFRENADSVRDTRAINAADRNATREDQQTDRQTDLKSRGADQEENRTVRQEEREEKREALNEQAKERIRAFAERIGNRFNAALDRISKMANRVDSRIGKFEERGLDMSEAQVLVDTARLQIIDARGDVSDALAQIDALLDSDNRKGAFANVREVLASAKESVKAAHASLVEAVRLMKAGLAEEREAESGDGGGGTDEE